MKYTHILTAFASEPWAMQPEKIAVVADFLAFAASGGVFSAEERAARLPRQHDSATARRDGSVAVIPVYGVLAQRMNLMSEFSGGTSYQGILRDLHEAIGNDDVKAVVLDIDSPGGSVFGAQELASEILDLRGGEKPIVAQVNHLAASAAYWIASAADEIVVSPSAVAGSIGVYTVHDDMSRALEDAGVKRTYIAAGEFKVEGNESEPLSKVSRAEIQRRVDYSYARFVEQVAAGRGVTVEDVEIGFGQGRVFHAGELVERGMADTVATLDETLERFGASLTPEPVRQYKAARIALSQAALSLAAKMKAGENITIREFEHGLKGLVGLSNSEAERAARLYLKSDQGDPDTSAEKHAALVALEQLLAQMRA